jgi:hypothetical protein
VDDLLLLMEECLGVVAVDVVKALTRSTACPPAARGFWGSLFLGIMVGATAGVPGGGVEKLVMELWRRSAPRSGVMGMSQRGAAAGQRGHGVEADTGLQAAAGGFRGGGAAGNMEAGSDLQEIAGAAAGAATAGAGAAAAGAGAAAARASRGQAAVLERQAGSVWEEQEEEEAGLLNRYSLREFVSGVVVLLRHREMHRGVDGVDCQRLHDQLLQVGREGGRRGEEKRGVT